VRLKDFFEAFRNAYETSTNEEKKRLSNAYENNIQIESICNLDVEPISYEDLSLNATSEFSSCLEKLKSIQSYLYDNLLKLKGFEETVGTLKNYYEDFYDASVEYVCPFCGLDNMLTSKDIYREAFDHYMPRSKYPFVSFLRENLFPICNTCNSTFKGAKNPIDYGKVFYPFKMDTNDCKLLFEVNGNIISDIEISSTKFLEEIESWNELFDIRRRIQNFANKRISSWMDSIQELVDVHGFDPELAIKIQLSTCKDKFESCNFIREAAIRAVAIKALHE
jgi:hypothetical protein